MPTITLSREKHLDTTARKRLEPTEHACYLKGPDAGEGTRVAEHHLYGAYDPYSFT